MDIKKQSKTFQIKSIGIIESNEKQGNFSLLINEEIRSALKHLSDFSHVIVLWWFDKMDNENSRKILTTGLPYAKGVEAGVFACRSECRPNPIAMSICNIINIDEEKGVVQLDYIEAFDGTPIIDLKPYIPINDRVKNVKVAEWFKEWPEWREDAGEFFMEHGAELFGECE
jgi:tRNA-Thr(GGU) m(6)t(6)A37 methyltransferase TsaA